MNIWIDADACPVVIREIICRAAERKKIQAYFVANQTVALPRSTYLCSVVVEKGFDKADQEIVNKIQQGELAITQDIPLAAQILEKGAMALSPRGVWFSKDDIQARLTMRDFMDTLRGSGIHGGGPSPVGPKEKQAFANALDSWLAKTNLI